MSPQIFRWNTRHSCGRHHSVTVETLRKPVAIKNAASIAYRRCFLLLEGKQYGALSDFQYHAIFSSEFSVLPQKSSEYLQADSPSDANSRILSSFYKALNVNDLYSRIIFPSCNKHRFSMRYSPYQGLKRTISHPDTGEIRPSNGHYQNVKRTIPDCAPEYTKRQYSLEWPQ